MPEFPRPREKALTPEHPDIAESLRILAAVRRRQGRHYDAAQILARAFAIREKSLGTDHPATTVTRETLEAHRLEKQRPT